MRPAGAVEGAWGRAIRRWPRLVALAALPPAVAACAQADPGVNEFGIPKDPAANMVVPVLLALVVVIGILVAAALVAVRLGREKDALRRPDDTAAWWACGACGTSNAPDREACFACHRPRNAGPGPAA